MPCGLRGVGGKRFDHQDVDPFAQELDRLVHEIAERRSRVLVSGREDLDHRDDAAEVVADDDAVGAAGVDLFVRTMHLLHEGDGLFGQPAGI